MAAKSERYSQGVRVGNWVNDDAWSSGAPRAAPGQSPFHSAVHITDWGCNSKLPAERSMTQPANWQKQRQSEPKPCAATPWALDMDDPGRPTASHIPHRKVRLEASNGSTPFATEGDDWHSEYLKETPRQGKKKLAPHTPLQSLTQDFSRVQVNAKSEARFDRATLPYHTEAADGADYTSHVVDSSSTAFASAGASAAGPLLNQEATEWQQLQDQLLRLSRELADRGQTLGVYLARFEHDGQRGVLQDRDFLRALSQAGLPCSHGALASLPAETRARGAVRCDVLSALIEAERGHQTRADDVWSTNGCVPLRSVRTASHVTSHPSSHVSSHVTPHAAARHAAGTEETVSAVAARDETASEAVATQRRALEPATSGTSRPHASAQLAPTPPASESVPLAHPAVSFNGGRRLVQEVQRRFADGAVAARDMWATLAAPFGGLLTRQQLAERLPMLPFSIGTADCDELASAICADDGRARWAEFSACFSAPEGSAAAAAERRRRLQFSRQLHRIAALPAKQLQTLCRAVGAFKGGGAGGRGGAGVGQGAEASLGAAELLPLFGSVGLFVSEADCSAFMLELHPDGAGASIPASLLRNELERLA